MAVSLLPAFPVPFMSKLCYNAGRDDSLQCPSNLSISLLFPLQQIGFRPLVFHSCSCLLPCFPTASCPLLTTCFVPSLLSLISLKRGGTAPLNSLCWLPVTSVRSKFLCLVFKAFHGLALPYIVSQPST